MPTSRGQPRRDVAHPQTSRLVTSGITCQHKCHSKQPATADSLPIHAVAQTADDLTAQQARQSYVFSTSLLAHQVPEGLAPAASDQSCPYEGAELTLACQQLAEAAGSHAHQQADLQQVLRLQPNSVLSAQAQTSDTAPLVPDSFMAEEADCSADFGQLLEAAIAIGNEDAPVRQAMPMQTGNSVACDDKQEVTGASATEFNVLLEESFDAGQDCLTIACEELAQVATAHAAQRSELLQLMQQQLAPCSMSASQEQAATHALPKRGGHGVQRAAGSKSINHIKSSVEATRRYSTADTAAWPPAPPQCTGYTLGMGSRGKAAGSKSTTTASRGPAMPTAGATGTSAGAQVPDMYSLLVDEASVQKWLPAAAEPVAIACTIPTLPAKYDDTGITTSLVLPDKNSCATGTVQTDDCLVSFRPTGHTGVKEAEPSFGTVHAMLSAMQLPSLGLLHFDGPASPAAHVLHSYDAVVETATLAAAEGCLDRKAPGGSPGCCMVQSLLLTDSVYSLTAPAGLALAK